MIKTVCIIPARGGSKGLPGKNVKLLAGKPLISWPIKSALLSGVIDDVFVTTDDEEIAQYARDSGADVPFLRDPNLAEDDTTTEATLKNALKKYEKYKGIKYGICVYLTCTDIFRSPEWITEAVNYLKTNETVESAFSVSATHKNFWHKGESGEWERILPWMREYSNRQIRQKIYREDTGLASASRAELWRQGCRIGDIVHLIPNELSETVIDIHTAFDLFLAEQAISYLKEHDPERVILFL